MKLILNPLYIHIRKSAGTFLFLYCNLHALFVVPKVELVLLGVQCLLLISSVSRRLELVSEIPETGTNYKCKTSKNLFDKYVDIFQNVALHLLYENKLKYRVVFRNYDFTRVLLDVNIVTCHLLGLLRATQPSTCRHDYKRGWLTLRCSQL